MPGSFITLEQVTLRFRHHTARTRSLKESVLNLLLRRRYGNGVAEILALDGIDLHLAEGDRLGIVGDNGAGKSSLLRVISRIYPPTSGRVTCRGFLVPLLEIGAWFNMELSGVENILLTGAVMGFSRREMLARVDAVLDFAELRAFRDTPVKYYSTGMTQRLAFTVATAVDPQILLLDEVFSVGDIRWVERARERMRALIDRSRILVLVSHQLHQVEQYCTRAIWLHGGRIVESGSPGEVVGAYRRGVSPASAAEPASVAVI